MHLIEIPDKRIKRYLPEDLSECDPTQYIDMSALIFYYVTDQCEYEDFRIRALYQLLNMKAVKKGADDLNKQSRIWQLSQLIDSFFEHEEDKQMVIKQYYINNPIPKFLGTFRNYYGPADEFNDVKFGEYIDALEAFVDFNQTGENQYLYRLLAVMYRTKSILRNKNTPRDKYDPKSVADRAVFFRHQPIGIVYGFYLYFASFQKYLSTAILTIEGREIDLSVLFEDSKAPKSKLPGIGMRGVLYAMAESGVFGSADAVREITLWEVLLRMYDIVKRAADEEAAFKAVKK